MIDHTSLHVTNHDKSKEFYVKALKPLGYEPLTEGDGYTGMGAKGWSDFWISEQGKRPEKTHIAFFASNKKIVHEVYQAALDVGAKDNGPPGPRPDYSPTYYAAFFFDPDGHNIEVVNHGKE